LAPSAYLALPHLHGSSAGSVIQAARNTRRRRKSKLLRQRTTQLYDRRRDEISLQEVERIRV
jgi:hypothetical protein